MSKRNKNYYKRRRLLIKQENKCNICHKPLNEEDYSILDHIIPKGRGGIDHENNIQVICGFCNVNKTLKDLKDIWVYRKKGEKGSQK